MTWRTLPKAILVVALACALLGTLASAAYAEYMTTSYAKHKLRSYINRTYNVDRGPYISNCQHLSSVWVRCDVEFKAGLYWRCGRGWVRWRGGYIYTKLRAPIGC